MKLRSWTQLATLLVFASPVFALPVPEALQCDASQASQTWAPACSELQQGRIEPTATYLAFGQTLIAGGYSVGITSDGFRESIALSEAEIYEEGTGRFVKAIGAMRTARYDHTATRLLDGKILFIGGTGNSGADPAFSSEIYHPLTQTFSQGPWLRFARASGHTATLLNDGRVLVVGGRQCSRACAPTASAELYDPATGVFVTTGSMSVARERHTATLLPDGRVLVTGGSYDGWDSHLLDSAEIYDPARGVFSPAGHLTQSRVSHAAAVLLDGRVLVVGGFDSSSISSPTAEIYSPATQSSVATGSMQFAPLSLQAETLDSGKIVVLGSYVAQTYDPSTGTFSAPVEKSVFLTHLGRAVKLHDGRYLMCGGMDSSFETKSAYLYKP